MRVHDEMLHMMENIFVTQKTLKFLKKGNRINKKWLMETTVKGDRLREKYSTFRYNLSSRMLWLLKFKNFYVNRYSRTITSFLIT